MSLLSRLLSYVLLYKYVALGVVDYTGSIIIPWPVNALLLAIGAFSSQGYFNFWLALTVAVVSNCLGDLTGYMLTRRYGEKVIRVLHLHKVALFNHLKEELRLDASVTVLLTRFAGSLSSIANFLAGLVGVPFIIFFSYDFLGNFVEQGGILLLGYLLGNYWNSVSGLLDILAAIAAVVTIIFVFARIHRRIVRRLEKAEEKETPSHSH